METRTLIAYTIMLAMALVVAGVIFQIRYHGRDRTVARQRLRQRRRREERMAAREAAEAASNGQTIDAE